MKGEFFQISQLGEKAILIDFYDLEERSSLKTLLFFRSYLEKHYIKYNVEVINAFNSILMSYDITIENFYEEFLAIKMLISKANIDKFFKYKIFDVPVCYDEEFAHDLAEIAAAKNIEIASIITAHTSTLYQINFIGFLPGFLYMKELDEILHFPRKKNPRKMVEKGSVGIAENQCGIYPNNSPGGWQILGRSPLLFFDKKSEPPSPFLAGDQIRFYEVSKTEFYRIEQLVRSNNFELKWEYGKG